MSVIVPECNRRIRATTWRHRLATAQGLELGASWSEITRKQVEEAGVLAQQAQTYGLHPEASLDQITIAMLRSRRADAV